MVAALFRPPRICHPVAPGARLVGPAAHPARVFHLEGEGDAHAVLDHRSDGELGEVGGKHPEAIIRLRACRTAHPGVLPCPRVPVEEEPEGRLVGQGLLGFRVQVLHTIFLQVSHTIFSKCKSFAHHTFQGAQVLHTICSKVHRNVRF